MITNRARVIGGFLLLGGLTLLAYLPALHGGFIFDDDTLLAKNPLIRAPDGLFRFWFTGQAVDYWPMTMTTFWLEWRLWGLDTLGYHVTNVLLQIGDAALVWAILRRLRVPGAYWGALLFAVHPVNVQSVAWIAERKNTLSLCFFLGSILLFLHTRWSGAAGPEEAKAPAAAARGEILGYGLSLLAFLLAMLSKGSAAVLPLVLLGLIAWQRRLRFRDLVLAAPFFTIAAVLTRVNIEFQNHGLTAPIRTAGPVERLLTAAAVVWFYLAKALAPLRLIFIYPLWHVQPADPRWWLPLVAALGLTGWLVWRWRRGAAGPAADRTRADLLAWLYFGVALVPVMGFADIYFMKFSLVADHYQYPALIGVMAWLAAAWTLAAQRRPALRPLASIVPAAVAGLFVVLTWNQARGYRDAVTLYTVTLERNPGCWLADNNLGIGEAAAGQPQQARAHFQEALRLNPDYPEAHFNLGLLLLPAAGGAAPAAAHFARAVQLSPRYVDAHYYYANSLRELGRGPEAVTQYELALQGRPNFPEAENNLGITLASAGRVGEALPHFAAAVRLNPAFAQARLNLAYALRAGGREAEAQAQYQEAVRLDPRLRQ